MQLYFICCMVEVCEVSPEMKEQKDFLIFISGETCSKQFAVSSNLFYFIVNSLCFPLQYKRFLVQLTIVFFIHSLSTYQNYKVIILNIWYKKLLSWGFVELLTHYFQIDHSDKLILFERPFDLLATGSLRATKGYTCVTIIILVNAWQPNQFITISQLRNILGMKE